MKPPCLDLKFKSPKSTRYRGETVGIHTLVAPRGNPELGPPLSWDYRCGNCGSVCAIDSHSISQLKTRKGCRNCTGVDRGRRVANVNVAG